MWTFGLLFTKVCSRRRSSFNVMCLHFFHLLHFKTLSGGNRRTSFVLLVYWESLVRARALSSLTRIFCFCFLFAPRICDSDVFFSQFSDLNAQLLITYWSIQSDLLKWIGESRGWYFAKLSAPELFSFAKISGSYVTTARFHHSSFVFTSSDGLLSVIQWVNWHFLCINNSPGFSITVPKIFADEK